MRVHAPRPAPVDLVVDTSALVALLLDEPSASVVMDEFDRTSGPVMSAANLLELLIVADARGGSRGADEARGLVDDLEVVVVPADPNVVADAHRAWQRFGRGSHPAALNFGDCFGYALASAYEVPLLCLGDDFRRTDLVVRP